MGQPARKRVSSERYLRPMLPVGPNHRDQHASTSSSSITTTPPRARARRDVDDARRALSAEEERLVYELENVEGWRFRGARAFVAMYGFDLVVEAAQETQQEWDRGAIENPAAFLHWLVRQKARGGNVR